MPFVIRIMAGHQLVISKEKILYVSSLVQLKIQLSGFKRAREKKLETINEDSSPKRSCYKRDWKKGVEPRKKKMRKSEKFALVFMASEIVCLQTD